MLTNQWLKQLTDWSEGLVSEWAIANGWHVLHVADLGSGASMIEGRDGKVIMPDLQIFDLAGRRPARLVEVKTKTTGAYKFEKLGIWCTGTDRHKWQAYKKINAAGIPVDLAFIHLKARKEEEEYNPHLLWASLDSLPEPMEFSDRQFPSGAVVWDIDSGLFQHLGYVPVPPTILAGAAAVGAKMHPWDRPPRLRRPRKSPNQPDLFDA